MDRPRKDLNTKRKIETNNFLISKSAKVHHSQSSERLGRVPTSLPLSSECTVVTPRMHCRFSKIQRKT